ncbi:hypothetical protein PYW07_009120 [Mythimna separata]|uniref:UDP-glycosyltransferases domain-containing protein n=1 Tax=Mythimna separata TaxID=271217 RepID=A0AAD7YBC3_MYTSE|nr:hypothetical protein PYW07_009120 [Mythimna separata]
MKTMAAAKAPIYFLLCLLICSSCEAYKALVVFGMPSKSHSILGDGVVRQLLKEGHEVTYITAFEYKNPPPNLRQIDVSSNIALMPLDSINIQKLMDKVAPSTNHHDYVRRLMLQMAAKTVENKDVQRLINDPNEHFDVVIVEYMFSELIAGFAPIFDCPLIWVSPVELSSGILSLIDAAPNPAYSSDALSSNMPPFTFTQRVEELWSRVKARYSAFMYYDELHNKEYERLIVPSILKRGRQPPSFADVRYNASLVLGNSHISMGLALGMPQNYKPVGGYHIDEDVKPLPQDLEKIMMGAKNGVIYFSMGSNLKSKDWPEKVKTELLKMFGELKQTVLWKFEEDLPNAPKNVHILKWAPQPSILAHPKCVLFITHGGLLSTTETIHYGVPIIGIPVFGDQPINVKRSVNKGFALEVNLSLETAKDLKVAIEEILHNPKYRQKVKELSYIYHDRPVKPGAELRHWVQHVVATRGALHLRSPAVDIPLYQRLYLDLAGLLCVAVYVFLILTTMARANAPIYFLLCLLICSSCEAYKALIVFGMPTKSHSILGDGVVRPLLKAGHEVTYIRTFEYKNPPPNLRQIDVSSNIATLPVGLINIQRIMDKVVPTSNHYDYVKKMAARTVENKNVQRLINDPNEHFDVVIVEWMFSELIAGFAPIFDCPLIWVSSMELNSGILSLIDAAPNPAYSTDALSSNLPPFTFKQRVEELWSRVKVRYNAFMYDDELHIKEYERLIVPSILKRGRQPPSFADVRYNASLVLGNSHISMGLALGMPQNYKPVGGYHIDEDVKPLTQDLEKIMISAKNGVIYFSMGSNLKSKDWPEKVKTELLKMFGELKQTVLWKFEEDLPNVPKNVHILKWAPQPSILSHPKCVLFITHGGLLSTAETIHYGVPIIGIPVYGDQPINVKRSASKGFALEVNLSLDTAKDLKVAIEEILHNPKYRQKVKELSYIYHDRPVKPGAELRHWVQHVVATRGALHLRSPAVDIPLYQRLYLDLAGLLCVAVYVFLILVKFVFNRLCSKKKAQKVDKKKN